jgi:hypothetical protein
MKRKLLLMTIGLVLISSLLYSQGVHIHGVNMHINSNTAVKVHNQNLVLRNNGATQAQIYANGNIWLTGNLINSNSTAAPFALPSTKTGRLVFVGSTASSIQSTPVVGLYNLRINKSSGGLTLQGPVAVYNELDLSNGIIDATVQPLGMELAAFVKGGKGSIASHVKGVMKKKGNATYNAFTFPLGTGQHYRPAGFYNLGTASEYTAYHVEVNPNATWASGPFQGNVVNGTTASLVSTVEHWVIQATGNPSARIVLSWSDDYSKIIGAPENLLAAVWNGTAWRNMGASSVSIPNKLVNSFNTTNLYGNFTLASTEPPPVKGDVNNDYVVNVLDVVWMVSHLNGSTPAGFNLSNADVNNDGLVNLSDLVGIINIILGTKDIDPVKSSTAFLHLDANGNIQLESDGTLAALQFQLIASSLEGISINPLFTNHEFAYTFSGDTINFLVYSLTNTSIPMGVYNLFEIGGYNNNLSWGDAVGANINPELVEVVTTQATSVIPEQLSQNIRVFPNPSDGLFTVEIELIENLNIDVQLFDITGRQITSIPLGQAIAGTNQIAVRVNPSAASGYYTLRVRGFDPFTGKLTFNKEAKVVISR